jgi:Leucine-rich repeat (LRR) protein
MTFGFSGNALIAFFMGNNIGIIGDGAISGVSAIANKIHLYLSYCQINTLGAIFDGLVAASGTIISVFLNLNYIDGESLKTALNSLSTTPANIYINLAFNNVTVVPGQLFSSVGTGGVPIAGVTRVPLFPMLTIILSANPISSVISSAFTAGASGANLNAVWLYLDYPTAGAIQFDGPVGFDGVTWNPFTDGSFIIDLSGGAHVNLSFVQTLGFSNPPATLSVSLQNNGYTEIPSGIFAGTSVNEIDLSYNSITRVANDAFTYNFNVQSLTLSYNNIGVVPIQVLDSLPVLRDFRIDNNFVWALPQVNTHISSSNFAANNIMDPV